MTQIRSNSLIAMGSNQNSPVGDLRETLLAASEFFVKGGLVIRKMSEIYRTPAFPIGSGPDFANAVVSIDHTLGAQDLLGFLHSVEQQFGRTRKERWGPRVIDLDLLSLNDEVLPSLEIAQTWIDLPAELQSQTAPHELILPHPRLQDRAFVLVPMADVAPDWRHPILKKTVAEMLKALPGYLKEDVKPYI